MAHFVTRRTEM